MGDVVEIASLLFSERGLVRFTFFNLKFLKLIKMLDSTYGGKYVSFT